MSKRGNGEGSISKRQDGSYVAVVSVPGPGGTRRRKSYYGKTREQAASKLNKALGDLQRGITPVMNERTTVRQYLNSWLEDAVKPNHRSSTYVSYEGSVRLHIVPALGHIQLTKLTPAHVRKLMSEMSEKTRPVKPTSATARAGLDAPVAPVESPATPPHRLCSPRTIQYARAVLRMALKQAVADGLVYRNVVELTPGPAVRRLEIRPLTPAQVGTFLSGTKQDRLSALYVVAFTMGMRKSEILGLRWQNVDLENGSLRVSDTLDPGKGINLGVPKSERSRRTLMMSEITLRALRAHKEKQEVERRSRGVGWGNHDFVFTTPLGTPLDHRNIVRHYAAHMERLGLPRQRFHDARHSCATFLLSQGVELRVIQEILGHSQIGITADLYTHVMPTLQKDAMRHIDRAFSGL